MLVQHTTKFLHQQKQARILLKLDITKAFDLVSWPFLLEVMQNLGFGPIWCDIVSGLLATSSTQILLNGSPGDRTEHRRGLRQGDPLSPMLFILVMDVLCHMVKKKPLKKDYCNPYPEEPYNTVFLFMQMMWSFFSSLLPVIQDHFRYLAALWGGLWA